MASPVMARGLIHKINKAKKATLSVVGNHKVLGERIIIHLGNVLPTKSKIINKACQKFQLFVSLEYFFTVYKI